MKKSELIKLVKESVQEVTENTFYGNREQPSTVGGTTAVVPTDEYPFSARPKRTGTGMMENEGELADLEARLAQLWIEMENDPDIEMEGGPVADQYADEIYKLEKEIAALKGGSAEGGPSYDEVYLKDKLVGFEDAYEYDNGEITIYPDIGALKWKTRSTQEILFRKDRGELQFLRAFGYEKTYYALKNIFPELPEMRDSSYSGFINVGESDKPIPVDLDTAQAMIDAMKKGRDAEASAQSAFYTRKPGSGGTGIDEDMEEQAPPGGAPSGAPSGQPNQDAAKGTGKAAKKGPKPPKPKKHKYNPDDLAKKQAEMMKMQSSNIKVDIYNMKQQIRFTSKTKSNADPKQQGEISKQIADMKKQIKELIKSQKELQKQISTMKNAKSKPTKEGFIKTSARTLLNQYEEERGSSNLREHMKSHKKQAKRQMLMEGAMKKFFEYFDMGNTNEEIVQLYAQKGVSVPEQFVGKARSQYEGLKKLKLELETSEQNFKDVSKMMVNNASEEFEGLGSGKTLASGLTK